MYHPQTLAPPGDEAGATIMESSPLSQWLIGGNDTPWGNRLDMLGTQGSDFEDGSDIGLGRFEQGAEMFGLHDENIFGNADGVEIGDNIGFGEMGPTDRYLGPPDEAETVGDERQDSLNESVNENNNEHGFWNGHETSVWLRHSPSGDEVEEEEDQEPLDLSKLFEESTCVASVPSEMVPHGYDGAMTGSETVSTMVDIEKMWARRDDEEEVEESADFLSGFPGQELGDVAFSQEPDVHVPPSLFEQISIIARQTPDEEVIGEEEMQQFLQQPEQVQRKQLKVFYDCLANFGPDFGVTRRLSQESIFRENPSEADLLDIEA